MKIKKKLYIILTIIILGILGVVGFSYAYFSGILGTGNNITISSARLGLIYEDGTSEISADTSKPGSIYEKTFKATNESDTVLKYNIEWTDVENTYVVKEELVYRIEKSDGTVVVEETVTPSEDGLIIGGITINPDEVHEYKLIIEFKNLENNSLENMGKVFNGKIEINTDSYSTEFAYTGFPQTFTVPEDGYYEVELWGAQGGSTAGEPNRISEGGTGTYTKGKIYLTKGENIYVYVGEANEDVTINNYDNANMYLATYNGGGAGGIDDLEELTAENGYPGGGATDIRLVSGSWNNSTSLRSRIMVASGGGGAGWTGNDNLVDFSDGGSPGGGLIGNHIKEGGSIQASQTSGNAFGIGGNGTYVLGAGDWYASGSGAGYYGGISSTVGQIQMGGSSGSSYISGYGGVNSVLQSGGTSTQPLHTNNTIHYSGKYFIDPVMLTGAEKMLSIEGNETVGNEGNGKAKITYLGKPTPKKITTDLDNVRYIKDCINGSNVNTYNWWNDVQAIKSGINIALGKTVTGTITQNTTYPYTRIVDGNTLTDGGNTSDGLHCITVDLGQEYDLDEIVIWHYYQDGRTYNNHTLSVGPTSTSGTTSLSTVLINNRSNFGESSQGFRFSAYENEQRKYYNITTETVEGQSVSAPNIQSAGDLVGIISRFTNSNLYGGVLVRNANTNEQYLTVPKTDAYFTMPAFNIKITPIINKTFSITKGSATGGSFSIATTAEAGTTVSFTTTQSTGYYYNGATVTYSGGTINLTSAQKSFTMPSGNITVTPRFAKTNYTVTGYHQANVISASANVSTATYGQTISFTVGLGTGYYYNGATVTNASTGAVIYNLTSGQKSFSMPAANVRITPKAAKTNYTITRTSITGGTVNSVGSAQYGQTVTFTTNQSSGFSYAGARIYHQDGTITTLSASQKSFVMRAGTATIRPKWKYQDTVIFSAWNNSYGTWVKNIYDTASSEVTWSNHFLSFHKTVEDTWSRQQAVTSYAINVTHYATFKTLFHASGDNPYGTNHYQVRMYAGLVPNHNTWLYDSAYYSQLYRAWNTSEYLYTDITNATGNWYLATQMLVTYEIKYAMIVSSASLTGRTYS